MSGFYIKLEPNEGIITINIISVGFGSATTCKCSERITKSVSEFEGHISDALVNSCSSMLAWEVINFGDHNSLHCVSNFLIVSHNELEVVFDIGNLVSRYPVLVSGWISGSKGGRVSK